MTLYFLFLLITGGISAAIIHICKLPASPDAFAMVVVPLHTLFCMMKGKGPEEAEAMVFILRSYKVSLFPDLADRCHRTTDPVPDTAGERPELGIYTAVFHLDIFWFLFCTVL